MPDTALTQSTKPGYVVMSTGDTAQINIVGEIGWWKTSGERFIQLVDELISQGIVNVNGYINSPGGSMDDANEIGNQINRFTGAKRCMLGSLCASAGTTLSTYFDPDKIVASPNTQYMIHDPSFRPPIARLKDFDSAKQRYVNLRNQAISDYVKVTSVNKGDQAPSRDEIDKMMEAVTWMNAEKAKADGFIAHIEGENDNQVPEDAARVLKDLYAELNAEAEDTHKLPEIVNHLVERPKDKTETNQKLNTDTEMDEKLLKNRLIVAFGLTSVTESSTLEDVVNAALHENKEQVDKVNNLIVAIGLNASAEDAASELVSAAQEVINSKDREIQKLKDAKKADEALKLTAVLDIAKEQGKIVDKQEDSLKAMAESSGLESVIDFLKSVPARKKITDQVLDNEGTPSGEGGLSAAIYGRMAEIQAKQS